MAQTKNTFIKSKMNRDLDERLVPNGEYREALNIQVSQSEDADVGTLSTALGNTLITEFGLEEDCNAKIIGMYADEKDKNIFFFITNFIDTSSTGLTNYPTSQVINQIWARNINSNTNTKLVEGQFLNFSITHEILNIDLLDDLLFWTDNRNQPRKINIAKANPSASLNPNYYTNEDQICVAKYAPCDVISLMKDYIVSYSIISGGGGTGPNPANYVVNNIYSTVSTLTNGGEGLTIKVLTVTSGNITSFEIVNQGSGYIDQENVNVSPRTGSARIQLSVENQSTMKNKCTEFLPDTLTDVVATGVGYSITSGSVFQGNYDSSLAPYVGSLVKIENAIGSDITPKLARLTSFTSQGSSFFAIITWPFPAASSPQTLNVPDGGKLIYGLNPDYDNQWPGDCEYLKDKFVRFSYRFKFDDNEYSTIAPFTQACFIPVNNGYFLKEEINTGVIQSLVRTVAGTNYTVGQTSIITQSGNQTAHAEVVSTSGDVRIINGGSDYINGNSVSVSFTNGSGASYTANTLEKVFDTNQAFKSTENKKFENLVNNIDLQIPCPNFLNSNGNTWDKIQESMHVDSIEIIYKDDAEDVLKVLDSINVTELVTINQPFFNYQYQSSLPIKTLEERDLLRVSDKVPLRALTQEVSGNRIIYGNYVDGHTSNATLDYQVASSAKFPTTTPFFSTLKKEYQNHTLKQNRNYQVGVVLSDRYGRQSDVVLSEIESTVTGLGSDTIYGSSTTYHPYYSSDPGLLQSGGSGTAGTTWPGDSLKIQFNSLVPENNGLLGYPGLFVGIEGANVSNFFTGGPYLDSGLYPSNPVTNAATTTNGSGTGLTVDYWTANGQMGPYSPVINNPGFGYANGDTITISSNISPTPGNFQAATFRIQTGLVPNLTGWYSYRVVVKQQEQDYYNVYLPGILNGNIVDNISNNATSATLSLYGDNINKIPKDLTDVGPTQTSFRTSEEELILRVQNFLNNTETVSRQFYPETETEDVVSLSELSDLGFNLSRNTQAIDGSYPNAVSTINLTTFNESVSNGASVTILDGNGNTVYGTAAGLYALSYFKSTSPEASVVLNEKITLPSSLTPYTITFGASGIVYNSFNNPLVGFLNTSESIGVSEEKGFVPSLAVFETSPVVSQLNIFYETSTSGTISDLNDLIVAGSPAGTFIATVSNVESSDTLFNETKTGSYTVTNSFTPVDFNGDAIVDAAASGALVSVFDDNGSSRINEFQLENNNGVFTLKTNRPAGIGYYVGSNNRLITFNCTVKITSNGSSVFKSFQIQVGNSKPTYGPSRYAPNPPGAINGTNYTSYLNGYGPGQVLPAPSGFPTPNLPPLIANPIDGPQLFGPLGFYATFNNANDYDPTTPGGGYGTKSLAQFVAFNGSGDNSAPFPNASFSQPPLLNPNSLRTREVSWFCTSWKIGSNTVAKNFDENDMVKVVVNGQTESVRYGDISGTLPDVLVSQAEKEGPNGNSYQIYIGEDYAEKQDNRFGGITDRMDFAVFAGNSNSDFQFLPSPGLKIGAQPVNNFKCGIGVRPLTSDVSTSLTYDPDGDPSGLQQGAANLLNFFGNNNNYLGSNTTAGNINPLAVSSIPIASFIERIEHVITIQASDGSNLIGEPSVIKVIQLGN
jgi:hypothetical protein